MSWYKRASGIYYHIYAPPLHGTQIADENRICVPNMPGVCINTFWTPLWGSILIMASKVFYHFMLEKQRIRHHKDDWTIRIYQVTNAQMKDVPKEWQWASTGAADVNEKVLASLKGAKIDYISINGRNITDLLDNEQMEEFADFIVNEQEIEHKNERDIAKNVQRGNDEINLKFDMRHAIQIKYKGQDVYFYRWDAAKTVQIIDKWGKIVATARNPQEYDNMLKDIEFKNDNEWTYAAYTSEDLWGENELV